MTNAGEHGGAGEEETTSILFAFSTKPFEDLSVVTHSDFPIAEQIDLVPTISLLYDLPIPFENIGKVIPGFFSVSSHRSASSDLLLALSANALQVWRYLCVYFHWNDLISTKILISTNHLCTSIRDLQPPTKSNEHWLASLEELLLTTLQRHCLWLENRDSETKTNNDAEYTEITNAYQRFLASTQSQLK